MSVPMSQPDAKFVSSPRVADHTQIAIAMSMGPRFSDRNLPSGLDQSTSAPFLISIPAYAAPDSPAERQSA